MRSLSVIVICKLNNNMLQLETTNKNCSKVKMVKHVTER